MAQHPLILVRCSCCRQYVPVQLWHPAVGGARWTCGWCALALQKWFEREMSRR
jgi:hypothetical protein